MTNVYHLYETDKDVETRGIDLKFPNFTIRVARAGGANKRFAASLQKKLGTRARAFDAGMMDPDEANKVLAEVYADCVILGWEGVTDRDGQPLAFSKEACVRLFTDLPDLFQEVVSESQRLQNFRVAQRSEDAGN
jgi:hypothetical protein